MAEARHTFMKSKMNKDLDARILPDGEYRDAQNIAVSKSEGPDVGALENVLGNLSLTDFNLTDDNLEIIGHFEDQQNNRIFVFLTNYSDGSTDRLTNFATASGTDNSGASPVTFNGSGCYICCYNTLSGAVNTLVSGHFLNFSQTHQILGVNLIENLLFWTDNRNQPRKINVDRALLDSTYYTTEDQISVSKYYPWEAISFLDNGNSTLRNESDEFLPYHTLSTISSIGAVPPYTITLTAPNTAISVNDKAYSPDVPGGGYGIVATVGGMPPNTITLNDTTGAALDPSTLGWNVGRLTVGNEQLTSSVTSNTSGATNGTHYISLPNGGAGPVGGITVTGTGVDGKITVHVSGGIVVRVDVNQAGKDYANTNTITFDTTAVSWMDPASGSNIVITIDTTKDDLQPDPGIYFAKPNPDYDTAFGGDADFLEDKFPRFSYRYKFDDGEYSLMAPFSQPAFIPDQGGCFLLGDEDKAKTSGVVEFMKNWVDTVGLNIPLPTSNTTFNSLYKVDEIEILYKDSSSQGVYVIDTVQTGGDSGFQYGTVTGTTVTNVGTGYTNGIYTNVPVTGGTGIGLTLDIRISGGVVLGTTPINQAGSGYTNGDIVTPVLAQALLGTDATISLTVTAKQNYLYWYRSQAPYKLLPENDLIRVHDKIPVRAKAQSTSGNRIIYGNFYDKHTSPNSLNYELKVSEKNTLATSDIRKEFPNHTLKQNRNYQVGVVLVDRFGRSSNVILRETIDATTSGYSESTLFAPYSNGGTTPYSWPGNSLKVNFIHQIPATDPKKGYPGLYSSSNPLGWYSYKIVVKQQEQEYYNLYLPGATSGNINWMGGKTNELTYSDNNAVSNIALFGENINKIPKELKNVGPTEELYGSNVQLYNRVNQIGPKATTTFNTQSAPATKAHDVIGLQAFRDLGAWTVEKVNQTAQPFCYPQNDPFFNADDNPFIASLSTTFRVGYPHTDQAFPYWYFAQNLIVYETEPVESKLDIFWETTSSGLISELNSDIQTSGAATVIDQLSNFSMLLDESYPSNTDIVNNAFEGLDALGNQLADQTATINLDKIVDGSGVQVQTGNIGLFELYQFSPPAASTSPTYKIRTNSTFVYTSSSSVRNQYTFYLTASGNGGMKSFTKTVSLSNKKPNIITAVNAWNGTPILNGGESRMVGFRAVNYGLISFIDFDNGSVKPGHKLDQLAWYIDSVIGSGGNPLTQAQIDWRFSLSPRQTHQITNNGVSIASYPTLKVNFAQKSGPFIVTIKVVDTTNASPSTPLVPTSSYPAMSLQETFVVTVEMY